MMSFKFSCIIMSVIVHVWADDCTRVGFSAGKAHSYATTAPTRISFNEELSSFGPSGSWDGTRFCAKAPGHYFFSFHAMSSDNPPFTLSLVLNDVEQVTVHGDTRNREGFVNSAGNSAMLQMNKDDCVWLQLKGGIIYQQVDEIYTTFTGYMVQPSDPKCLVKGKPGSCPKCPTSQPCTTCQTTHIPTKENACLTGWVYKGASLGCIKFGTVQRDWDSARSYCKGLASGADLLILDTEDKRLEMVNSAAFNIGYWIGGNDRTGGTWKWINGKDMSMPSGTTTNGWWAGQPNKDKGQDNTCAFILNTGTANVLRDELCTKNQYFALCQIN